MGWCSGTDIFDEVTGIILTMGSTERTFGLALSEDQMTIIIASLIKALDHHDWDCEQDSGFWDNPVVIKAKIWNEANKHLKRVLPVNPYYTFEQALEVATRRYDNHD